MNADAGGAEGHLDFIGGEWRSGIGGPALPDEDPSSRGSIIARFQASGPEDAQAAASAAQRAFPEWRGTRIEERQRLCARFVDLLRAGREELAVIVSRENGKTLKESRSEIDSALKEGEHAIDLIASFSGATLPPRTGSYLAYERYEPLGVVALICPWNFPVNTVCRKAMPAILAGNTVVFKPASFTPWSGIFLTELFERAGFPIGTFNCVTGAGSSLGNALIEDPRVKAISFTGSTEVGRRIQATAAKCMKRTQLEMGGKNSLIILADADLDATIDAALTAGFANAGQWCTATSRILVQESVYAEFRDALVARCEKLVVGNPLDEGTAMGPVAGPDQFRKISEAIARAKAEGGRMLAGGLPTDEAAKRGYFILPTLFDDVKPDMALFRDEVFGPVIALTRFKDMDEALRLANDSAYGLSSSIFTKDLPSAMRFVDGIEAGLVHVNLHTGVKDPGLPFGGWKESGFGPPEDGRAGLEYFQDLKAVYIKA